ncbi:hypothetical protein ANCDUO_05580 [Ancylostoma duodenale]|uniref:ADP/ATP translocase n=1 Tax=Ancylostoma duodenale TaxID=51022 RepID=A0A0C2DN59_9BILA|nr:hypothetical protein ANCDUO_05580 [Ancylostoma duodenale]
MSSLGRNCLRRRNVTAAGQYPPSQPPAGKHRTCGTGLCALPEINNAKKAVEEQGRMSRQARPRDPRDVGKFAIDLAVGGASAAISKTVVAPVERVKLLLQALNFAFNDLYKSVLLEKLNRNEHFWKYTFRSLAAGGCAGSTTLCFVYPLDFIRTRLSVDVGTHKANRDYTTYFIYRAVYFGMYDTIRQFVQEDKKNLHFVSSFFIAQGVSICSAYLTYPWDTVRRRMMIKGTLSTGHAFAAAKRIVAEEEVAEVPNH